MLLTSHPLPLFPSLITWYDLAFNSKPIILPRPLDINISKRSHRSQNSSPSDFFIRQFIEVERERGTGFGDHPSGSEVARFAVSLDYCLDFGWTRVWDVRDLEETLPKACEMVSGAAPRGQGEIYTERDWYRVVARNAWGSTVSSKTSERTHKHRKQGSLTGENSKRATSADNPSTYSTTW